MTKFSLKTIKTKLPALSAKLPALSAKLPPLFAKLPTSLAKLPPKTKTIFKKILKKQRVSSIVITAIAITTATAAILILSKTAQAAWYNESWRYRKKIEISYTGLSTLSDHQIKLSSIATSTLYSEGKVNADCSDIRFTNANGALLKYWIADSTDDSDTTDCTANDYDIWVKVPSIPFSGTHIYMYYGNPTAKSESDGQEVFEFFEDFDGSAIDSALWDSNGSPAITGGNLALQDAAGDAPEGIVSKNTFCDSDPGNGDSCVVEFRAEQDSTALANARMGFSNTNEYGMAFEAGLATFTPGAAKRNVSGAPFAGGVLVQGSASKEDIIDATKGSLLGNNFYGHFDRNQGSISLWYTPEFDSASNTGIYGLIKQHSDEGLNFYYDSREGHKEMALKVGGQTLQTAYTLEAGTTYHVVARWQKGVTLDGTNHLSLTINDTTTYAATSNLETNWTDDTLHVGDGAGGGIGSAEGLIEGLTIYRRPLFDGTYGIDVGNGDEIAAIYNSGSGQDPTLITGSWDVVFALPTNATTGALTTGEGEAWTHPHASNVLYTDTTNTGGFMMNGTYTSDGWADEGTPSAVAALDTAEKIYAGGYKYTSTAANQGIYYETTGVSSGDDFVIRALGHSDGTCAPQVLITEDDGTTEISHLDGTTASRRADPDVYIFTWEANDADANGDADFRVKLINTAASGTCFWHQVEVLENLVSAPSFEAGANPTTRFVPTGWSATWNTPENGKCIQGEDAHTGIYSYYINDYSYLCTNQRDVYTSAGSFYTSGGFFKQITGESYFSAYESKKYVENDGSGAVKLKTTVGSYTHTAVVGRQTAALWNASTVLQGPSPANGTGYFDDLYVFSLTPVSLTVTPASLANSTESTGIRVDGTDTLTQPIANITTTSGTATFTYTPRHNAADIAKFGESTPAIATLWGDSDDYIKLYWSAANTITLAYSMDGTAGSDTYDATSAIAAGTTYNLEINYTGGSDMTLDIDGTTQITLGSIPSEFGTVPDTVYWGTNYDGSTNSGQADATFNNWPFFAHDDSAAFLLDSTTESNHETETYNTLNYETNTVGVLEDTNFNNFLIMLSDTSTTQFEVNGTSVTHSTQVPNTAQHLRFESSDTTNTLSLDHVFVRKLATTSPSVEAYADYGSEEEGTGPIAHYTFDEGSGEWAYNVVSPAPAKDPVLYLDMDDGVSGDGATLDDASGYGNDGTTSDVNASGMDCTVEGAVGTGACDFDGVDDYVEVTSAESLDFSGNFTLSTWFKSSNNGGAEGLINRGQSGDYEQIKLMKRDDENQMDWQFAFNDADGTRREMNFGAGTEQWSDNTWHQIVAEYENPYTRAYIDGILVKEERIGDYTLETSSENWYIGQRGDDIYFFNGTIDEVKIYDYALTEAQILAEYQNSAAKIVGATHQPGIIGSHSLRLDGTDDYAIIKKSLNGVQSMSFWVRPTSTTEYFIDLDGGTHYISASSGTLSATGFSDPTIYVNGEESSTIEANKWQLVTVSTGTAFDATETSIGKQATNYYQGEIDDLRFYDHALSASEVKRLYNAGGGDAAVSVGGLSAGSGNAGYGSGGAVGPSSTSGTLMDGLVGYWRMDDTNWTDYSGNGNDGTGYNGVTTAAGKFGSAGSFDGVDDYVETTTYDLNTWTISTWINRHSDTGSDYENAISLGGNKNMIRYNGNYINIVTYSLSGGYQTISNISAASHYNQWIHVVLKFDGKDAFAYLNNKQIGSRTVNQTDEGTLYIGTQSGVNRFLDGDIDEIRIYNRALSSAEIEDLYLYGPGPIAEYSFGEGAGVNVHDSSGNGNHGTTYSGASISELAWTGLGRWGNALDLDGSNDYVSVGDIGNVNSISFWAKPATTTEYFLDLNGTANVDASSGTVQANNFTSPTIYVNGRQGSTISADEWSHVVVTTGTALDATSFNIGKIDTNYMEGLVDEVKVYNYVLTQRDVAMLYSTGRMPDPVGHWKFNEGHGTSAQNATPGGNTGTITGATWYNEGRFGKALDFDGDGDQVDLGDIDL